MKRVLLVMAILAITAVGAAVAYQAAAGEREYRELMAQGDSALAADARWLPSRTTAVPSSSGPTRCSPT